jgi:hypothetical protein
MSQTLYLAVDLVFVLMAIVAFPRTQKHTPSPLSLAYPVDIDTPTKSSVPTITVSEVDSREDYHFSGQNTMRVTIDAPEETEEQKQRPIKKNMRPATPYVKGDFPTDDLDSEDDELDS